MKNALTSIPGYGGRAVSEPWRAALRTFDADLQRRGAAERTRKAYGTDAAELAAWATANAARPHRRSTTRPCGAGPPASRQKGAAPRTMARKLASAAQPLPLACSSTARSRPTPPTCCPRRSSRRASRRRSSPRTSSACWRRSRPRTPLEMRDRALFELAYSSGLRAEELVDLDVTVDRLRPGAGPRRGQGVQDALRARRGARAAHDRRLSRARPPGAAISGPGPGAVSCPRAVDGSPRATCGADCGSGRSTPRRRPASTRTRSGTPSPPTCWTAARTCARSRRCSVTRVSRRPRSTLG